VNDELPPLLPSVAPFAGGMPSFNPAFTGATASYPGMDRVMQQQMMMMMQMQQAMMMAAGGNGGTGGNGMAAAGAGGPGGAGGGPKVGASHDAALGPPPGGEDPRAKRGRVSYLDLDEPGGAGDGGLPY